MFGKTGSPEQFEKFKNKHFNSYKTLTKGSKCFGISIKNGEKVSTAFREAIRAGPIKWFKPTIQLFFIEFEL